jgi:hypothetical protein
MLPPNDTLIVIDPASGIEVICDLRTSSPGTITRCQITDAFWTWRDVLREAALRSEVGIGQAVGTRFPVAAVC